MSSSERSGSPSSSSTLGDLPANSSSESNSSVSPEPSETSRRSDSPPSPRRLVHENSSPVQPSENDNSQTPERQRAIDPPTPNLIRGYVPKSPASSPQRKRSRQRSDDKVGSRITIKRRLLGTDESSSEIPSSQSPTPTNEPNNQSFHSMEIPPENDSSPPLPQALQATQCYELCDSVNESVNSDRSSDAGSEISVINNVPNDDEPATSDDNSEVECETNSESSGSDSEHNNSEEDLLYPGTSYSVNEAVLQIMELYMKHHWTQESLKDTLKTFHNLLPASSQLPSSVYTLFKHVEEFSNVPPAEKHWYCSDPDCFKPKDGCDQKCSGCGNEESSKFFNFSLGDQIKHLFEQRNLAEAMDSFRSCGNSNSEVISDITSGTEYAKIKLKLKGLYDIVLLWNTDGVSVADSGTQLWPILCVISEIPPNLRSSYLLVAGIWCDSKKPPMNMFLRPFVSSLERIMEEGGIEWTHPTTGENHKSLVVAPIFSGDAPAKAEVLNVQYFSALHGCNSCEQKRSLVKDLNAHKGNKEQNQKKGKRKTGKKPSKAVRKMRRFVHHEHESELRSGPRMDRQGIEAEEKKKPVKGVQGRAAVSKIPFFDRGPSVCAEYMHSVLLGVVKYFTLLWCFTSGPWFIGNDLKKIDQFLKSIRVPDFVNRLTKGISKDITHWKASEYRSWLLYYSLPALYGIYLINIFNIGLC